MVIVTVTTHYYDGKKSFPIEIKLYQHSSSLAKGKDDEFFEKKTDIGIELIDRSLSLGLSPGIVLIDGGYGNNTTFLKKLEERKLKYLGKIAKKRKVIVKLKSLNEIQIRINKSAKKLPSKKFKLVILSL
jgi:SRSO17 transposase